MATNVTFNNIVYPIPNVGDVRWGQAVTNFLLSVGNNALSKAGGNFTLTADVNFGATYGIASKYFKSVSPNIAQSGVVRFANNEGIAFRNAANSADLALRANASDLLEYNGQAMATQLDLAVIDNSKLDRTSGVSSQMNVDDYVDFDEESVAPGAPSAGKIRVYGLPGGKLKKKNSSNVESDLGSSGEGGINYVPDGSFEGSVDGVKPADWTAYLDAAGVAPVDGTGGSPSSNVTFLASNSSPLRGNLSAILNKDAVNRQGTGFSCPITIAKADRSKTLRLYVETEASTNYVTGDAALYLYDITNSVLITPTVASIPKQDGASWEIEFDLTTSTSYRLCLHIATTSALAWTLKVDSMILNGEKILGRSPKGRIPYTGTPEGFGTVTANSLQTRRDDEFLFFSGRFTPGTATAVTAKIPLPSGLTIGQWNGQNASVVVGKFVINSSAVNTFKQGVLVATSGDNFLSFGVDDYTTGSPPINALLGSNLTAGVVSLVGEVEVPIAQWASSSDGTAADNDIEYASFTGTVDADSNANGTEVVLNGNGTVMGALTTTRNKYVKWAIPPRKSDLIFHQISSDNGVSWSDQYTPWEGTGNATTNAGVRYLLTDSNGVSRFQIGRYSQPSTDAWSSSFLVRFVKISPKKPAGVYKAGRNNSGWVSNSSPQTNLTAADLTSQTNCTIEAGDIPTGASWYTVKDDMVYLNIYLDTLTVAAALSLSFTLPAAIPRPKQSLATTCIYYDNSGSTAQLAQLSVNTSGVVSIAKITPGNWTGGSNLSYVRGQIFWTAT